MSTNSDGKRIPLKYLNIQVKKIEELYAKLESYTSIHVIDPITKEKDTNQYYIHTSIMSKLKEFGIPEDFFKSTLFLDSYPYLNMDNIFYKMSFRSNKYKTLRKVNGNRITKKQQKFMNEYEKAYLLFSCIYPFYLGKYGFDSQSNKSIFVGPFVNEKKGKKKKDTNIDIGMTYNKKAMITFGIETGSYEKPDDIVGGGVAMEKIQMLEERMNILEKKTEKVNQTKDTIPLYTIFSLESFEKWKTSMNDVLMATGFLNADHNIRIQIIQGSFFNENNAKQALEPYFIRDEENYRVEPKERLKFKFFFGITGKKKPTLFLQNLRKQIKKYRDIKKLEGDIKKNLMNLSGEKPKGMFSRLFGKKETKESKQDNVDANNKNIQSENLPDEESNNPDDQFNNPDEESNNPDEESNNPDDQSKLPGVQSNNPDDQSKLPGVQSNNPDDQSKLPGVQSNNLGIQSNLSNVQSNLSNVKSKLPGVQSNLSNIKSKLPGVQSNLSNVKSKLSNVKIPSAPKRTTGGKTFKKKRFNKNKRTIRNIKKRY